MYVSMLFVILFLLVIINKLVTIMSVNPESLRAMAPCAVFSKYFLKPLCFLLILLFPCFCSSSFLHPFAANSVYEHRNHTAISAFRVVNRRFLSQCPDPNPYLQVNVSKTSGLSDEENVTVTVSGVLHPADSDWVAMISPSNAE